MAMGAIGQTIFVNQQTASVASAHGNQNNKLDMQNVMAQSIVNEKEEKVLEVRPAEENHEVDEDREHQRDEADRETQRPNHDDDEEYKEESLEYHLDIRV